MNNRHIAIRHEHADLIHAWAEGAEIEFYHWSGEWRANTILQWDEDTEYRVKPEEKKTVKMWEWIIKDMWGNLSTTNMFYKDNSIREIAIDSGQEVIGKAEWTMIEVEE